MRTVDFNPCSIPTMPLCILFQHHCRKCGAVVCGPCSSQKWLLAEQASKPLRVCLNCYEKLKQASGGGGGEVVGKSLIFNQFSKCLHNMTNYDNKQLWLETYFLCPWNVVYSVMFRIQFINAVLNTVFKIMFSS